MRHLPDHLNPNEYPWLKDKSLRQIFDAFSSAQGEARIVGGAVRDALMGNAVQEIDLAVNLPPAIMLEVLSAAGIKSVPTGLEHGTITAVLDHKSYEITSLRRDIETDGRHAKVTYTKDWQEDAARRDFTFNALYLDSRGQIYDYFNGREDLANGTVRFIGQASHRIREDVLRILRFFRFFAWFGKENPDPEGLKACHDLAGLLPQISAERVWRELIKLMDAPNPFMSLCAMQQTGVLTQILPEINDINILKKMVFLEKSCQIKHLPLRRFVAIIHHDPSDIHGLVKRLKLSNRDAETVQKLAFLTPTLQNRLKSERLPAILYEYGSELVEGATLLLASKHQDIENRIEDVLSACAVWKKPVFPLRGEDLLKINIAPGPQIGHLLRQTETWWVHENFKPDHAACLAQAKHVASRSIP